MCFSKISFILSSFLYTVPSKFLITGTVNSENVTFSKSFLNTCDTFNSFCVWNGPAVFKTTTFFAPISFAMVSASATASFSPDITICSGEL